MQLDLNPTPRRLSEFAVAFALAGALVGLMLAWRGVDPLWAGLVTAIAVAWAAVGWRVPAVGLRTYQGLTLLTYPIGLVVSYVLMAIVYFVILTPLGWLRRAFGGDPLQRRFDRDASSYWTPREGAPELESYFRQH
jgi:hypothetical protein